MPVAAPVTRAAFLDVKKVLIRLRGTFFMVDSKGDSVKQIAVERVSHTYRPARGREVLALEDVSLEIGVRGSGGLLGPSGGGKSTLLYPLGGLLPIEKGAIPLEGAP